MVIIKRCVRCDKEFHNNKFLAPISLKAIDELVAIKMLIVVKKDFICGLCRRIVGNEAAESILRWRNRK